MLSASSRPLPRCVYRAFRATLRRHEFRALSTAEVRGLLEQAWAPPGVHLPPLDKGTITTVICVTGGNFRLLDRLLTQTERIVEVNQPPGVSRQAVEAARERLVICQA